MSQTQAFLGNGTIYIQRRGVLNAPRAPIGNCSDLSFDIADDTKDLQNFEGGGGIIARVTRIKSVIAKITADSFSPDNVALALRGSSAAQGSTTALVAEAHAGLVLGSLVVLDRLPDGAQPLTVHLGATVIAEAGNYERKRSGLYILPNAPDLAPGDDLTVDYTPLADSLVQALTASGLEFQLVFDGLNEAQSGKAVVVTAHRVQFSPAKSLDLISDKFGMLKIEGAVLADEAITGSGLSRYFTVRLAD